MSKKRKGAINKYGLSRNIPADVKLEVRQKSGFGCVICGFAICQYEHVDPEFADAKVHDPDCMTLLCGSCNDKKRRGILSKQAVKRAMLFPKSLKDGFAFDNFDIGVSLPAIDICGSTFIGGETPIASFEVVRINNNNLLKFEAPEVPGAPYLLSAQFFDQAGRKVFWIDRNEWFGSIHNWDIETEGRTITIRYAPRKLELEITNNPNERIIVSKINMFYKGYKIFGDETNGITIIAPTRKRIFTCKRSNGILTGQEVTAFEVVGQDCMIGGAKGTIPPKRVEIHFGELILGDKDYGRN